MSWREDMQEGSFRGATFHITESDHAFGRRNQTHEYPERDTPWTEDLGRRARRWSIECFVVGEDYFSDRDALIAACEAEGPGALVHPYLGTVQACVDGEQPLICKESTDQGGTACFTLAFVEAGADQAPQASTDTQTASDAAADDVQTAAADDLDSDLDTDNQDAVVVDGGEDVLSKAHGAISSALTSVRSALGSVQGAVRAVRSTVNDVLQPVHELDQLINESATLLKAPAQLAAAVFGAVRAIGDQAAFAEDALAQLCGPRAFPAPASPLNRLPAPAAGALQPVVNADGSVTLPPIGAPGAGGLPAIGRFGPGAAAQPLGGLMGFLAGLTAVPETTSSRLIQAANQAALGRLVVVAAATTAVRVISAMDFTSYQDAAGIRDAMADQLDAAAILAADAGDGATADALDSLRAAMVTDVTARGGSLANLIVYTPPATVPAVVLAQRLYGDADRAEDILSRNAVEHPCFLPGGQGLEVLDA